MTTAVVWFRRDLRVEDNSALAAACRDFDTIVPVFILDDHYRDDPNVGPSRFVFLRESLQDLDSSLRGLGSRLTIVPGPPSEALAELIRTSRAAAVYANEEIGPYPQARDDKARSEIERAKARFFLFQDSLAIDPRTIRSSEGKPYTAYSPFLKKWGALEKSRPLPAPARISTPDLRSVPIGRVRAWKDLAANPNASRGGESEAKRRFASFLAEQIDFYADWRDYPGQDSTSHLSSALHFGAISARTMLRACDDLRQKGSPQAAKNADKFVAELCWREFFHGVLFHFPGVAEGPFRPELRNVEWNAPGMEYFAWTEGKTGYPFIDAAMRQLTLENWMHNRARMAVASFLVKDLHLSWQIGEKWFEHNLTDADLANNNGGWQWSAGTGADAAPYFRVFSPVVQSKRFDPTGSYIRRYVPELAGLSDSEIHEPQNPIVDHAREKEEAIRRYRRASGKQ